MKKGISLIILVITIIVMIIVASVVIVNISNSNIIDKTIDAVKKTDFAQIEELASAGYSRYILEGEIGNSVDYIKQYLLNNGITQNTLNKYNISADGTVMLKEDTQEQNKRIVTEGLEVYYDAINNSGTNIHENNIAVWKDLSGNSHDCELVGCTWGNDYLSFDGIDDYGKTFLNKEFVKYTIEAFVHRKDLSLQEVVSLSTRSSSEKDWSNIMWFYDMYGNKMYSREDSLEHALNINMNGYIDDYILMQMVVKDTGYDVYINNTKIASLPYTSSTVKFYYNILGKYNGYTTMNMHSFRIYSRALTEEELTQNYDYEINRYTND